MINDASNTRASLSLSLSLSAQRARSLSSLSMRLPDVLDPTTHPRVGAAPAPARRSQGGLLPVRPLPGVPPAVSHVALARRRPALEARLLRLLGDDVDAAHGGGVHAADEERDHGGGT